MKAFAILTLTLFTVPALARIDAYPSIIRFHDTAVGLKSLAKQVTVTNRGTTDIAGVQVTDACAGSFEVERANCLGPVRANQSCYLTIAFTPVREGPLSCSISISDGGSTKAVEVSGRGEKHAAPGLSEPISN